MSWGGVPLNTRTALMMDEAQILYGATITATQGSPNPGGVGASAGTHDGEGVIDVVGADLDAIVIAMRMVGFAAWHRTPAQGFTPHVHGVAVGEPLLSSQAANQVAAYFAGLNGLASNLPDDGPRTWVGVTWESYTGGTPLPTGDRPQGAPFWGESLPLEDSWVLAGSPVRVNGTTGGTTTGGAVGFAAQALDTQRGGSGDDYVRIFGGDTVLWIITNTGTYLAGNEDPEFSWRIQARGTGTLTAYDDIDPSWDYDVPANSLGVTAVDSVDWTELVIPTATPTVSSILDGDGQRFAVTATGTVEIDRVCLAVYPAGGPVGDWSPTTESAADVTDVADNHIRDVAIGYSDYLLTGIGSPPTWTDGWDQAVANVPDPVPTPDSIGISGGYNVTSNLWSYTVGVGEFSVGTANVNPTPAGDDGVTFIRRPDRTVYDADAYVRYGVGVPAISEWQNNVVTVDVNPDDLGLGYHIATLPYQPLDRFGPTVIPDLLSGSGVVSGTASGQSPLGLTTADRAGLITVRTDAGPGPSQPGGPHLGQFDVYLGDADLAEDPDTWLPLTAVIAIPDFYTWQPGRWPDDVPDDPDGNPVVTWLRQRQRNDGLGNSITRAKGVSSQQRSLRQRGYR